MSAYENVELPMIMLGTLSAEEIEARTKKLLKRMKVCLLVPNRISCGTSRQNEPLALRIIWRRTTKSVSTDATTFL